MKLTKSQRHKYYKEAFKLLQTKDRYYGLCYLLSGAYGDTSWGFQAIVLKYFPELISKRPKGAIDGDYWWPMNEDGDDKRIAALKACIKETAPKKKKRLLTSKI